MLLLAIADRTGFGQTARRAALEVEGVAAAGPLALALQLLSDISDILDRLGTGWLPTKTLIAELISDEEGPWLSYGKGVKPITERQLARRCKRAISMTWKKI